ncbi:MAG: hypothetical protein R2830_12530 [Saprospiraceae bacterium]|nr:hypothetical protein [Saprospiraceae bacterium]
MLNKTKWSINQSQLETIHKTRLILAENLKGIGKNFEESLYSPIKPLPAKFLNLRLDIAAFMDTASIMDEKRRALVQPF